MANEKRLIDANALIEEWNKLANRMARDGDGKIPVDFGLVICELSKTNTVDAVEIVRCQDCKYWGDEDGKSQREDGVLFARCNVHNYLIDGRHTGWCPTENDFCSYGERKEGAD